MDREEPGRPASSREAKGGLPPLHLLKNLVLKQTLGVSPATPFLPWNKQRSLESAHSSAAQLLLLQEPMATLKPMLPSQKPSAKEICFPALGTYSRIAPHLDQQAKEAPSSAAESSRHKRYYMGAAWASPEAPAAKDNYENPPEEPPTSPQTPALVCPEAPARPTLSCAGLPLGGVRMTIKGTRRRETHSLARQWRLHNTVEILRSSGLLSITLRTKELLRQNNRTQQELAQLQEQAQLLCEAVRSSDTRAWARLQDAISRSAALCPPSDAGGTQTHLR